MSSAWQIPRDRSVPAGSLNFRYSQFPFLFLALLFITLFMLIYLFVALYLQFVLIVSQSLYFHLCYNFHRNTIENPLYFIDRIFSIDLFLALRGKSFHLSSFVSFFIFFTRVTRRLIFRLSLQPISLFRADRKSSGSESLSLGRSTSCGEII